MAFKIVEKSAGIEGINDDEVSIGNYGMSFGKDISDILNDFVNCEVYLDRETRRVGLKPTNNTLTGFKISKNNNGKGRKSISGAWAKQLPNRRFRPTIEDDMIILSGCDIADKIKRKIRVE